MRSEATKQYDISDNGNSFFPQTDRTGGIEVEKTEGEISEYLRQLAQQVFSDISELDPARSKELLGVFVSELFLSVSEQERRAVRRRQQAEGIAAARERGVKFGRSHKPLPENFEEYHKAWRGGQMSLREAARACGMPHATFRSAALRMENAE